MNSGYIESEKILARKDIVEWLDGCGATIKHLKNIVENTYIIFGVSKANGIKYWKYNTFLTEAQKEDSTHCQTPEQFCELIAECLGIDKPVFGEPIKGMAIEVSRLSEEDKEWLVRNVPNAEMAFFEYVGYGYLGNYKHIGYQGKQWYIENGYTITDSPQVFMEYVAQQTGKEYKAVDPQKVLYNREKLLTILKEPLTEEELKTLMEMRVPNFPEHDFDSLIKTHPHKTYRILDSLDGIPLDKRFKLSEWIPPFGEENKVLMIWKDDYRKSYVLRIGLNGVIVKDIDSNEMVFPADGEWMRIV